MKDLNDMTDEEIRRYNEEHSTYIYEDEVDEYRNRVDALDAIAQHFMESDDTESQIYGHALYSLSLDFGMYMDDFGCRMPLSCFRKQDEEND